MRCQLRLKAKDGPLFRADQSELLMPRQPGRIRSLTTGWLEQGLANFDKRAAALESRHLRILSALAQAAIVYSAAVYTACMFLLRLHICRCNRCEQHSNRQCLLIAYLCLQQSYSRAASSPCLKPAA